MKESIEIINFGGIKKMKLEIKPINILIGPQASGKSVTIKLIYFFKGFFEEIYVGYTQKFKEEKNIKSQEAKIIKSQEEKFVKYFPKPTWSKEDFKIVYKYNKVVLSITRKEQKVQFNYENLNFVELINNYTKLMENSSGILFANVINRRTNNEIFLSHSFDKLKMDSASQVYIPSGRSFFSTIQNNIFFLLQLQSRLDPFLSEFGSQYEFFKPFAAIDTTDSIYSKESDKRFFNLCSEILKGIHFVENGIDYLIHEDGRKITIANASSGQQETLPLIIILESSFKVASSSGKLNLYIEEPEAHLFPTAQKKMVQLMARTYNSSLDVTQLFITTHSPYILSSFNNLLKAGILAKNENVSKKKLHKIVPEEEIIKPEDIIAYSLKNGKGKRLYDKETGLIGENIIDEVSDELSMEFGKLLDLEFGDEN